jgi:polar amino acid transport system substrate-binding protein
LRDEAIRYSAVLAGIFLALILLSYALALKMQALISRPILNLAEAARRISDQGDLSQRVSWGGQDEIGILYDGYNRMLDQLQARLKERDEAEAAARIRQQQLLQAGKMVTLGTLVSGVAHEINNPNAYIMLNASLALRKWEDMEAARIAAGGQASPECVFLTDILSNINRGSQRIDRIVKRLKDYYRKDQAAAKESLDLNDVAEKALEILDVKIRKSTRNFTFFRCEDAPKVMGNLQELEQVLINLIENACQALPDPDRGVAMEIFCEADGSVAIRVRDEGVGIPQEHIERITDPFFTTKREMGGTGLGLSLALGIMNDHGGRMEFDSVPGRGTTVTITLPSA